jgi:transcriptional repressor NrdR
MSGVKCPSCHQPTRVVETRAASEGAAVRRRRACPSCGERFTTFERLAVERLHVRKRDGRRQPFDREKLRGALLRAAHKRDVSAREVEAIVRDVERAARDAAGVISAERIGEVCLERLRELDGGAYLQFAGTLPDASPEFAESRPGSIRPVREHA